MDAVAERVGGEIVEDAAEFFAPTSADMVDGLISQYQRDLSRIERVVEALSPERLGSVVQYFLDGNQDRRNRFTDSVDRLFSRDGAVAALNASYWRRALDLTDVLDFMPTERREEWFESIRDMQTPDFSEETVRATLGTLLHQRMDFLAEKVDGTFRALSRTHVTNQPEGFSKRMILTGVTNDWGMYARRQTGHINDLRQVISKFQQRDEPDHNASNRMVEIARREHRGEWLAVDGGTMRIRCYKNGNAHLEVHPDIAWRLNEILAHLHPMAIPSEFRTKPKRKVKEFTLYDRPLPFVVLELLHKMQRVETRTIRPGFGNDRVIEPKTQNPDSLEFGYGNHDKHALAEAEKVLAAIGGVKCSSGIGAWWEFDYNARPIINEIVVSGVIPDQKSHQYYPTPAGLAAKAVEMADIQHNHNCLEPSAGTGILAALMPGALCVEISPLHCRVLEARGHEVVEADFLAFAEEQDAFLHSFDRVLMNPPFSEGRWKAHTEAAATLVRPGGRMVAILPASAQNGFTLPGFDCSYSGPYDNEFAGASVSVVILKADYLEAA